MTMDRNESIAWSCAAGSVIIFVAGLLVGVRDTIGNTNVALILVVFIVAAAVFGGRMAGVTAAVVAATSFNFFHTQPYLTLRIKEGEDVITVALLVVVGLIVGELALMRQRTRHELVSQAAGARRLEDVVALLAADAAVEDTWTAVRAGIVDELGLRSAQFLPGAGSADLPLLTRSGRVVPTLSTWTGHGFQLPDRASIPVVASQGVLGHVAIEATPGHGVSLDERRVAVALADVLALALEHAPERISPMS
jgi:K+-sensing histidine kinase KdpD